MDRALNGFGYGSSAALAVEDSLSVLEKPKSESMKDSVLRAYATQPENRSTKGEVIARYGESTHRSVQSIYFTNYGFRSGRSIVLATEIMAQISGGVPVTSTTSSSGSY